MTTGHLFCVCRGQTLCCATHACLKRLSASVAGVSKNEDVESSLQKRHWTSLQFYLPIELRCSCLRAEQINYDKPSSFQIFQKQKNTSCPGASLSKDFTAIDFVLVNVIVEWLFEISICDRTTNTCILILMILKNYLWLTDYAIHCKNISAQHWLQATV